jgi:hypothetical protein
LAARSSTPLALFGRVIFGLSPIGIVACGTTATPQLTSPYADGGALGAPCRPAEEYTPTFLGFDFHEVTIEATAQCQSGICLVNHFQGRVTCPYGQTSDGTARMGATACAAVNPVSMQAAGCCTPGMPEAVTGPLSVNTAPLNAQTGQTVPGQCVRRPADRAVTCSCRCANINGATNDGNAYCACAGGFSCSLVSSTGSASDGTYCVETSAVFDPNQPCVECDPKVGGCGSAQGVGQ